MNFLPRYTPQDSSKDPVDLSSVHADDALIELLRTGGTGTTGTSGAEHRAKHLAPEVQLPVGYGNAARISGANSDGSDTELFDLGSAKSMSEADPATGPLSITDTDSVGRHRVSQQAGAHDADDALTSLLQAWQAELASTPLPEPLSITEAVAIVRSAPAPRRSIRPVMAIAAAIFALLMGSAAIGSRSATPGDILWPVTQLLWSDRADSVIAGRDARQGIDSASAAIVAGHPDVAVAALEQVTIIITKVQEQDGRVTLESDYQRVSAELESMTTQTATSATPTQPTSQASTNTTGTTPSSVPAASVDSGSQSNVVPPPATTTPVVPTTTTTTVTPTTTSTPTTPSTPTTSDTPPPVTSEQPVDTGTSTTTTTTTDVTTPVTTETPPPDTGEQQQDGPVSPNNDQQGAAAVEQASN